MRRSARLNTPVVLHHVMGHGIEKRKIFLDDRGRVDFISRMGELVKEDSMKVLSLAKEKLLRGTLQTAA